MQNIQLNQAIGLAVLAVIQRPRVQLAFGDFVDSPMSFNGRSRMMKLGRAQTFTNEGESQGLLGLTQR